MSTEGDGGGDKRTRQLSTLYTWQEETISPRQGGLAAFKIFSYFIISFPPTEKYLV